MPRTFAQDPSSLATTTAATNQAALNTQAAAAVATGHGPEVPSVIKDLADQMLSLFHIRHLGNSWERLLLAAGIVVVFYLLRRILLPIVFHFLRKLALRTTMKLDDEIIDAVEKPMALFVMLLGVYVALRTLVLPESISGGVDTGAVVCFSITFFWLVLRIVDVFLQYAHVVAKQRDSGITAFMPWIRKAVITLLVIFATLTILGNIGVNVQAFIAGLGIGGLALALAAQDTVANVFGAAVVAVDQPFRLGDTVQLASHTGTVEDIGIRSMKLRRPDKALVIIPNKTVAAESIINLSKFTNRRVEQVLGFTYDSTPEQMSEITKDIIALINAEPDVMPGSVMAYFRDFSASSLDLWVVYVTKEPDFAKHMELRQRLNLAFMRATNTRRMSFAFPTQTIDIAPSAAKVLGSKA